MYSAFPPDSGVMTASLSEPSIDFPLVCLHPVTLATTPSAFALDVTSSTLT